MTRREKLIYLLADGAHARFVEQSSENGAFVTFKEMDGSKALAKFRAEERDHQPGRSFESGASARHSVGRENNFRRAKEEFAASVAESLNEYLSHHGFEGVVLVAPPRLLSVLRADLTPKAKIVAELGKDLTKAADHTLGEWLGPLALARIR
jgi:protein required for attachment to host cells